VTKLFSNWQNVTLNREMNQGISGGKEYVKNPNQKD
jgi:hypothetical protein